MSLLGLQLRRTNIHHHSPVILHPPSILLAPPFTLRHPCHLSQTAVTHPFVILQHPEVQTMENPASCRYPATTDGM